MARSEHPQTLVCSPTAGLEVGVSQRLGQHGGGSGTPTGPTPRRVTNPPVPRAPSAGQDVRAGGDGGHRANPPVAVREEAQRLHRRGAEQEVGQQVHFRYVVFHPFLDEILIGKIKGCSPEGVHVSLGFFDDILIPPESLQQPAKFDEAEQVWVWEYETEEGAHDLYMDTGEEIRFRVVDESFVDTSPTGPSSAEATSSSEELPRKEAPYTLVRSSRRPGASRHPQLSFYQEDPVGLLVPPQILAPGQAPFVQRSNLARFLQLFHPLLLGPGCPFCMSSCSCAAGASAALG
ncbi:DNA-directed RNA polymerase III subunit RPC8 isoform 2-T2 [Dugong dugon]